MWRKAAAAGCEIPANYFENASRQIYGRSIGASACYLTELANGPAVTGKMF